MFKVPQTVVFLVSSFCSFVIKLGVIEARDRFRIGVRRPSYSQTQPLFVKTLKRSFGTRNYKFISSLYLKMVDSKRVEVLLFDLPAFSRFFAQIYDN